MKAKYAKTLSLVSIVLVSGLFSSACERVITTKEIRKRNGLFYAGTEQKPYTGKVVGYRIYRDGNEIVVTDDDIAREFTVKDGRLHGYCGKYYNALAPLHRWLVSIRLGQI